MLQVGAMMSFYVKARPQLSEIDRPTRYLA